MKLEPEPANVQTLSDLAPSEHSPAATAGSTPRRIAVSSLALALFAAALLQLAARVARTPLAVDEAESSINALSILERGYPGDRYLGIPIYENMLVRPWPDHPEYEFKDISYSDRGFAVYHGWLPLYAIAASFRLFGIQPPKLEPGWKVVIDLPEFKRRTLAARAPSFVAAAALLAVLFLAARRAGGIEAAVAVLVLAGQSSSLLSTNVFARYYALSLLLSAVGWLTLQSVCADGSRRNYAAHACVLIALFYTQLIAFATLTLLTAIALAACDRRWQTARRAALMLSAVAAAALPWVLTTGFLEQIQYMPSGRSILRIDDVFIYLADRQPYLAIFAAGSAWLVWSSVHRRRVVPDGAAHGPQLVLLFVWAIIAAFLWFFATPAASVFPQRLSLSLFVPGLILMATMIGAASRTVPFGEFAAAALAWSFLAAAGLLHYPPSAAGQFEKFQETFEFLNGLDLKPDAKVYAAPGTQLVLSFYGEKPIQSLAPVRRQFLDSYPGEVVYLEGQFDWEFTAPSKEDLQVEAARLHEPLSDKDARRWAHRLRSRLACERVRPLVFEVKPPLEALPPFAEAAMRNARARAQQLADKEQTRWDSIPFSRGFNVRSAADLWPVFFYRLVDPEARRGSNLNAATRLRGSRAECLPTAEVVTFYSARP